PQSAVGAGLPRDEARQTTTTSPAWLRQRGFVLSVTSTIIGNLSVTAIARQRGKEKRFRPLTGHFLH
ncbi:MAG: hypothetical protein ACRERW_07345, partial [Pseudomonas sp.]